MIRWIFEQLQNRLPRRLRERVALVNDYQPDTCLCEGLVLAELDEITHSVNAVIRSRVDFVNVCLERTSDNACECCLAGSARSCKQKRMRSTGRIDNAL